jgi:hypothetical protein
MTSLDNTTKNEPKCVVEIYNTLQKDCLVEALENYIEGVSPNLDWYYETRTLLKKIKSTSVDN